MKKQLSTITGAGSSTLTKLASLASHPGTPENEWQAAAVLLAFLCWRFK